jgi:hypothetical protein
MSEVRALRQGPGRTWMALKKACHIALLLMIAAACCCAQNTQDTSQRTSPADQPAREKTQPPKCHDSDQANPVPQDKAEPNLPNAPSDTPLTKHQKFETFLKRTYSPYTFASAAFNATWAQMWGDYYDYGGGMEGWSKRFGASLANTEVRTFLSSFALPVVFKQDPRYFPSKKHGFFPRAWYAGTRILVARSDSGKPMFNYSEVLGVLFTSSVQNSYYPRRDRGFDETLQRLSGGLSSDATSNLLQEFSPEIHKLARKIVPKKAQKIEQKLPAPVRRSVGMGLE